MFKTQRRGACYHCLRPRLSWEQRLSQNPPGRFPLSLIGWNWSTWHTPLPCSKRSREPRRKRPWPRMATPDNIGTCVAGKKQGVGVRQSVLSPTGSLAFYHMDVLLVFTIFLESQHPGPTVCLLRISEHEAERILKMLERFSCTIHDQKTFPERPHLQVAEGF